MRSLLIAACLLLAFFTVAPMAEAREIPDCVPGTSLCPLGGGGSDDCNPLYNYVRECEEPSS